MVRLSLRRLLTTCLKFRQNPKALVWRWKQIWTVKINISTLNISRLKNKVSIFKLTIEDELKKYSGLSRPRVCLIDYQILKTAGLAGLKGLPNLLLQQAEGLADFGEILAFICETLKTRRIGSCCYGN